MVGGKCTVYTHTHTHRWNLVVQQPSPPHTYCKCTLQTLGCIQYCTTPSLQPSAFVVLIAALMQVSLVMSLSPEFVAVDYLDKKYCKLQDFRGIPCKTTGFSRRRPAKLPAFLGIPCKTTRKRCNSVRLIFCKLLLNLMWLYPPYPHWSVSSTLSLQFFQPKLDN